MYSQNSKLGPFCRYLYEIVEIVQKRYLLLKINLIVFETAQHPEMGYVWLHLTVPVCSVTTPVVTPDCPTARRDHVRRTHARRAWSHIPNYFVGSSAPQRQTNEGICGKSVTTPVVTHHWPCGVVP